MDIQVILMYAQSLPAFFSSCLSCLIKDIASAYKHFLSYILRCYWLQHTPSELIFPEIFYAILSFPILLVLPIGRINIYLCVSHPRSFRIAFEQLMGQLTLVPQHLYLRYQYAQIFVLQVASSLCPFSLWVILFFLYNISIFLHIGLLLVPCLHVWLSIPLFVVGQKRHTTSFSVHVWFFGTPI